MACKRVIKIGERVVKEFTSESLPPILRPPVTNPVTLEILRTQNRLQPISVTEQLPLTAIPKVQNHSCTHAVVPACLRVSLCYKILLCQHTLALL